MMMLALNELMPLATYCFVMSSTPGPNNLMLATSGANFGYRRSLPQILGMNAGLSLMTVLACMGLGALIQAFPLVQTLLRVAGALYLLFLAWKLSGGALGDSPQPRPVSFVQGALFQGVNPKSWIRSITLASMFMPPSLGVPAGTLWVVTVGVLISFFSLSMWTLFGVAIRHVLTDPRKLRVFNLLMAGTLVVLAVKFLPI